MRALLTKKRLVAVGASLVALAAAIGAYAYFTSTGSGSSTASVGTLTAPGQPTRSGPDNRVDLTWSASSVGGAGTIAYHVERSTSPITTWSDACGTTAGSGTTSTSCADSPGSGTFIYRVTALFHSWTALGPQSNAFAVDATFPVVSSISRVGSPNTNASSVSWNVTFSKSVTGVDSSDFALVGAGATGASITGLSGSGSSYTVSASTGSNGSLGLNLVDDDSITDSASNKLGGTGTGNGNFTGQAYTIDKTAPTGGALTVNATAASGAGTSSFNGSGTYAIGVRTDYTDSGSGLASSTLTRQSATLSSSDGIVGGTCGSFGSSTTITGNPSQTLTGPTCYLYTLTGTDNAGNTASISTIVKVDTTAPTAPTVAPSAATGNTFVNGSTVYINPQAGKSGGFTVGATTTDTNSGIQKVAFPSLTGFISGGGEDPTSPYSTTYAWSGAGATAAGSQTVTATNNATLTANGAFTVTPDTTAPSGGSAGITGLGGTGTLYSTSTTLSITLAKGTDSGSGLAASGAQLLRASATLSGGVCGTFGSFSQVGANDPSAPYTDNAAGGITTANCYRYQYLVPDNVGNVATYTSGDVKVDTTAPAFVITENATTLYTDGSSVVYFQAPNGTSFTVTASDPQSGVTSATFGSTTDTKWTKTTTSTSATWALNGANTPSTITSSSATNNASATGTLASISLIFDNTNPTAAVSISNATNAFLSASKLFYNGAAAGSFTLTAAVTDAGSGPASATFPVISTTGWTHAAETVTSGTGSNPTITYTSSTYTFTNTASNPPNQTITGSDNVANIGNATAVSFVADATAPTTTASLSPAANGSGWTNADTTVNLSSSDGTGAGVASITYSATGAQTISSTTVPGASAAPVITTEGTTTVTYFATDNVGNVETTKTITVKLDKTNPDAPAMTTLPSTFKTGQALTVSSASDNAGGSGVASVSYFYCAGASCTPSILIGTGSTGPSYSFTWSAQPADGTYTIAAKTNDVAGNTSAVGATQTVTVDNTAPTVTDVTLVPVGAANGTAEIGEQATITYSEAIKASTFCSIWTTETPTALTDVTVTLTQSGGSDILTVSTPSCTFRLASLIPGDYVSATATYTSSSIGWNSATKTLTITLGTLASGTAKPSAAKAPTYTTPASPNQLTDLAGNALAGNSTFTDPQITAW